MTIFVIPAVLVGMWLVMVVAANERRQDAILRQKAEELQKELQKAEELRQKAGLGVASAQVVLGLMYATGKGVPRDDRQAMAWLQKAADQGNAEAQFCLGRMYANGRGVAQDSGRAVTWYQKAAAQGEPQAVDWFQKIAAQGNAKAQFYLGRMYEKGEGIVQDYCQAVSWYQKAAAQGEPQALAWFQKAADQGNAKAQFHLGRMYEEGEGVVQDYRQAVAWYQKAAAQGEPQALAWFQKAADQGNAEAQFYLGWMYENGRGLAQDSREAVAWYQKAAAQSEPQAVAWFQKAAAQGNAEAQFYLGRMYEDGRGLAQDSRQAVAWFQKAAAQGLAEAQYSLGLMYENGRGIPEDYVEAYAWYSIAGWNDNEAASKNRNEIQQRMSQAQVAAGQRQVLAWYQKFASLSDATVQFNLGRMYDQDNPVEAYAWYIIAVSSGHKGAAENRDKMRQGLTPELIAAGQERAKALQSGLEPRNKPTAMPAERKPSLGISAATVSPIAMPSEPRPSLDAPAGNAPPLPTAMPSEEKSSSGIAPSGFRAGVMREEMRMNKPSSVKIAQTLLYCIVGVKILDTIIFSHGRGIPACILALYLIFMIGKGRNWARSAFLVLPIIDLIVFFVVLYLCIVNGTQLSMPLFLLNIGVYVVLLIALVFLFEKSSSEWFKFKKDEVLAKKKKAVNP